MSIRLRLSIVLLVCSLGANTGPRVQAEPENEKPAVEKPATDPDSLEAQLAILVGNYDKALKHAEAALSRNPKDGVALAVRATVRAKRDKDFKSALKDLEAAIEHGSNDVGTLKLKADCHVALGDHESALKVLQDCKALHPRETASHLNLGDHLLVHGSPQDAAASFELAAGLSPRNIYALDGMVRACVALEDYKRGIEYSTRLIEIATGFGNAWYRHGLCLWNTGSQVPAERAYERATELEPGLGFAWLNLGFVRMSDDRYAEALPPATRAVELLPDHPVGLTNLAAIQYELGKYEDCVRNVSIALLRHSTSKRYWLRAKANEKLGRLAERAEDLLTVWNSDKTADAAAEYGDALNVLHRFDLALKHFDEALKQDASRTDAIWGKMEALMSMNRAEEALVFAEGLKGRPARHPLVVVNRAHAINEVRGPGAAYEFLNGLGKDFPARGFAELGMAASLAEMGRLDEALVAAGNVEDPNLQEMSAGIRVELCIELCRLEEAAEICRELGSTGGDDLPLADELAQLYSVQGKHDEALAIRRKLAAKRPYDDHAHRDLARALAATRDIDAAHAAFSAAIRMNPWSAHGYYARADFLLGLGDDKSAKVDLEQALKLNPRHHSAIVCKAILHLRDNDFANAKQCLDRADAETHRRIALGHDPIRSRFRQAEVSAVRSRVAEAEGEHEQAVSLRKGAIGHLQTYASAGRLVRAHWQKALEFEALSAEPAFQALFKS